jgi:SpoVK/Ycf46/Vps4 family AAA+-type ATPase
MNAEQADAHSDLLDVDLLKEAEMAETAIDKLVMDPGNKELIKAIAKIYTATDTGNVGSKIDTADNEPSESGKFKRFSADFISGKGEGQIILLHGPPGTGKTLTAGI